MVSGSRSCNLICSRNHRILLCPMWLLYSGYTIVFRSYTQLLLSMHHCTGSSGPRNTRMSAITARMQLDLSHVLFCQAKVSRHDICGIGISVCKGMHHASAERAFSAKQAHQRQKLCIPVPHLSFGARIHGRHAAACLPSVAHIGHEAGCAYRTHQQTCSKHRMTSTSLLRTKSFTSPI